MANRLIIRVVEIRTIGYDDVGYSVIASDDYANAQSIEFDSIDSLLRLFPTEKSVIEEVLSWPEFEVCATIDNSGDITYTTVSNIEVQGYEVLAS